MNSIIHQAIVELNQANMYQAQKLFQKCLRYYPCAKSFNNMGVFYVFEGRITRNEKKYNASLAGKYLLEKALKISPLESSELALGYSYFTKKRYRGAARCYEKAYLMNPEFITAYNIALSYFKLQEYRKAEAWAKKAGLKCNKLEKQEALILELFSSLHLTPKRNRAALNMLLDITDSFLFEEKFVLTFLIWGENEAKKQIDLLLKNCWVDITVMAMIFEVLFDHNEDFKAKSILNKRLEELDDSNYDFGSEIKQLERIFLSKKYRKKMIASYQFSRTAIVQQCYQE